MIIVDTALKRRAAEGRPIVVALVGAGAMARGVANQIVNAVPGMRLAAIVNRTRERAERAWREAGIAEFAVVDSQAAFDRNVQKGHPVVTDDYRLACAAPGIDVLIEATGAVEFGARFMLEAFSGGKHVVTMNAELDGTVGAVLRHRAERAGVIYSLADGDQPGVELNLWRYVRAIGLTPLVCGNIKGLQDPYRTPTTQKAFAEKWGQDPYMVTSFADGTKISFEQTCVANATGMTVEQRGMRGGDFGGHVDELCHNGRYDIDRLRALGGVVDYTVGSKPSPGVFVLATHDDPKQKHMLDLYKLGRGPLYSFYTPYHLCHFEVPLSAARAVLFQDVVLAAERPMVDVITLAKRDLKAGEQLDALGGYMTYGQCEAHPIVRAQNLLPHGLAAGCTLKRDISKDEVITHDDVTVPAGRLCDRLRAEMESLFPLEVAAVR